MSLPLARSVVVRGSSGGPCRQQPERRQRTLKILHDELVGPDHAHTSQMTRRIRLQGTDVEVPVDVAVVRRSKLEILPNYCWQVIDVIVEGDQSRRAGQPDFQCDPVLTRQTAVMP